MYCDELMDGLMDGWMDGWMDGLMTNKWMDELLMVYKYNKDG